MLFSDVDDHLVPVLMCVSESSKEAPLTTVVTMRWIEDVAPEFAFCDDRVSGIR